MNLTEATYLVRYLTGRGIATATLTQFEPQQRPGDPPRAHYAVMVPRESMQADIDVSEVAYGTWLRGFRMIFNVKVGTFVFEKGQALLIADPDDPPVEATAVEGAARCPACGNQVAPTAYACGYCGAQFFSAPVNWRTTTGGF